VAGCFARRNITYPENEKGRDLRRDLSDGRAHRE